MRDIGAFEQGLLGMMLTCPSCDTRFKVPKKALLPDGRRVRCANCKYTWFQKPVEEKKPEAADSDIQPIPAGVRPDTKRILSRHEREQEELKRKVILWSSVVTAVVVVSLGLFFAVEPLSRTGFVEQLADLFVTRAEEKAFQIMVVESYTDTVDGEPALVVVGELHNTATDTLPVPTLTMTVQGEQGKLGLWEIPLNATELEGETLLDFYYVLKSPPADSVRVSLTVEDIKP